MVVKFVDYLGKASLPSFYRFCGLFRLDWETPGELIEFFTKSCFGRVDCIAC